MKGTGIGGVVQLYILIDNCYWCITAYCVWLSKIQFINSCLILCDPLDYNRPGFPVHS